MQTAIHLDGRSHSNPLLDTREYYEVEFQDGASTDTFTANIIAESMYSQVDKDGNSYSLISEIVNHKSDGSTAVRTDDGFEVTTYGPQRHWHTTRGWKLLVTWKVGSTSWVPPQGPKGIVSSSSGGVCLCKQDRRGTCFCLVGKVGVEEA
jgi:hypothetical protein